MDRLSTQRRQQLLAPRIRFDNHYTLFTYYKPGFATTIITICNSILAMTAGDYPADWQTRRREVFERDEFVCMNCERKGGERGSADLRAYHLVPVETGGTHDTTNLLTLCSRCKAVLSQSYEEASQDEYGTDVQTIDDLDDFDRAIEIVDNLERVISRYAAQIIGESDTGEGELVRDADTARLDARDVKEHILTCKVMFVNLNLPVMSEQMQKAHTTLAEELFSLLHYELALVHQYQQYLDILTHTKCPDCGHYEDHEMKFCGECSTELPVIWQCLQCHSGINRLDEDYCSECSNELADLPPAQQDDLTALRDTTRELTSEWQEQLKTVLRVVKTKIEPAYADQ